MYLKMWQMQTNNYNQTEEKKMLNNYQKSGPLHTVQLSDYYHSRWNLADGYQLTLSLTKWGILLFFQLFSFHARWAVD